MHLLVCCVFIGGSGGSAPKPPYLHLTLPTKAPTLEVGAPAPNGVAPTQRNILDPPLVFDYHGNWSEVKEFADMHACIMHVRLDIVLLIL